MHPTVFKRIAPCLLLFSLGCESSSKSVGGVPEETSDTGSDTGTGPEDVSDDGSSDSNDPTTTTDTTAGDTGGAESGEGQGDVGKPCTHDGLISPPNSYLLTTPASECAGDVCLFAEQFQGIPEDNFVFCGSDADCNGLPGGGEFICNGDGFCELSMDWVLERSMCSQSCTQDSECAGADDGSCATGFVCQRMAALGDMCCQGVCACADNPPSTEDLDFACEAGTANGCCVDQLGEAIVPTPPGCGEAING